MASRQSTPARVSHDTKCSDKVATGNMEFNPFSQADESSTVAHETEISQESHKLRKSTQSTTMSAKKKIHK